MLITLENGFGVILKIPLMGGVLASFLFNTKMLAIINVPLWIIIVLGATLNKRLEHGVTVKINNFTKYNCIVFWWKIKLPPYFTQMDVFIMSDIVNCILILLLFINISNLMCLARIAFSFIYFAIIITLEFTFF